MVMDASHIRQLIGTAFPDAEVTLEDLVGDGDHYRATIYSAAFEGKTKIQQHQMVYKSLGGRMGQELHALSLITGPLSSL